MKCTHHILMFLRSFLLKVKEQAGHTLTAISSAKRFYNMKITQEFNYLFFKHTFMIDLGVLDVYRSVPKILPQIGPRVLHILEKPWQRLLRRRRRDSNDFQWQGSNHTASRLQGKQDPSVHHTLPYAIKLCKSSQTTTVRVWICLVTQFVQSRNLDVLAKHTRLWHVCIFLIMTAQSHLNVNEADCR